MNKKEELKINIIEKIKSNKKIQYFLIIILSILLVVVFVYPSFNKKKEDVTDDVSKYVLELEKRLINTLKEVEGVGDVSVVITVESGMETILAMKTTTRETINGVETEEEPVIVNGKTVVLTEKYPNITGVLIVAEGADNIAVVSKIQRATTSLLEIEVGQIEILAMKK